MDSTQFGIVIGLKTAGFGALSGNISKLNKMSNSLKELGKNVDGLNAKIAKIKSLKIGIDEKIGKIGSEMSKWQSRLATAASFAVPVKFAIDDEAAFANVRKYVDDSEENLINLKTEMRKLSNELGESFANLSDIAAGGGKINLMGKELVKYTRLLATGATAFEMSSEDVSRAANNMKVGFKIDKVDGLKEFFDVVNLLDNKVTNAGASDILTATSLTAGNANLLGLNPNAASAMAASMLSTGKVPSVVGTSLNALYTKLANVENQNDKFQEALNAIGLDATYLKTAIGKDATGAVIMFLDAISKADKTKQAGLLYDLMGGNFSDEIAGLITNMGALKANMKLAFSDEANGSMQRELQVKLNTTKSALERLTQAWRNIASTIGEAFLPTLNVLTATLSALANGISWFMESYPDLSKVIFGIAGGLLAVVTIAPMFQILAWSMAIAINQVMILGVGISFLAKAFRLKYISTMVLNGAYLITIARTKAMAAAAFMGSSASKAYAGALNLVKKAFIGASIGAKIFRLALLATGIGALVVIAGEIIANWDKVKEWFFKFGAWMKGIFQPVIDWFGENFGGMFDWIGKKISWIVDSFKSVGKFLGFGGDASPNGAMTPQDTSSSWYNRFSDDEPTTSPSSHAPIGVASLSTGGTININLNGGFNIATSNGKFDLAEFEAALIDSVKRALARDERNRQNRMVAE
ncbi:TP901 family tail tape measure protein [Campylobacter hyointestinalis subsp. hyointestinalis]|uniref:TP901 family tail tape measure protein n=1 Tax=Campylobacter hyointestinalis subsp. hyointestinalis TaxID=91352 RepID=A0A9W5AQS8_CAMHY|nr:phage tail tape measure protein [Campylobacter hyointestinalis]CUU77362.1 TP901 family tail tape measure protein [Campylobacter hyointestinalis subsp. hyointestinalis]